MTKNYYENSLPKNFAQMLLNCQIQVELSEIVPKQVIMQILQLYSKGMQYFESIRSYKYLYFERKMNTIMRMPKIIQSMSSSTEKKQQKKQQLQTTQKLNINQEQKMKLMQVKHKYDKMYNDYIGQTSILTGDKIKKIVAENQVKLNQVKQSIKDQISEQERRLQLKIQRRKFQHSTKKSISVSKMGKSTKDSLFEDYECEGNGSQNRKDGKKREVLESDFTRVINQFEVDIDQDKINLKNTFTQAALRKIGRHKQQNDRRVQEEDKKQQQTDTKLLGQDILDVASLKQ